jgi:hypothetical protein
MYVENCGVNFRVCVWKVEELVDWGEVISHSPAPDYLRFDARLVSFWASRGPRDCAPELCGESSLKLNHRYRTSCKRITTV